MQAELGERTFAFFLINKNKSKDITGSIFLLTLHKKKQYKHKQKSKNRNIAA
jgi:hypothetical protein